jgi:cytochrome c556
VIVLAWTAGKRRLVAANNFMAMKWVRSARGWKRAVLILAVLVGSSALAHEGAHGIIAERMAVMKTMTKELKAIGEMLLGKVAFDAAAVHHHADVLHKNCHKVESMFPLGSIDHHSRAKPVIWEKPQAFHEEMQRLHSATERLAAVAASGNRESLLISFKEVGSICKSCHETFRLPGD